MAISAFVIMRFNRNAIKGKLPAELLSPRHLSWQWPWSPAINHSNYVLFHHREISRKWLRSHHSAPVFVDISIIGSKFAIKLLLLMSGQSGLFKEPVLYSALRGPFKGWCNRQCHFMSKDNEIQPHARFVSASLPQLKSRALVWQSAHTQDK